MLSAFHFLRPAWLFALLPLAGLLWLLWRQRLTSRSWQNVVDAPLLAHLLIGKSARQGPMVFFGIGFGGVLSILALAGPAWQKLEQPVFRQQSSLVILLDLSRSMDAADIKPSRLLRAELKLRDILDERKEGDTALVVFAAMPFVVSPLTDDAKVISSQVDSLSTDLMPAQGSRPDRAIGMAQQLLQQAGATHGGVLLITDGVDSSETSALNAAVKQLVEAGHRLSVLGVGTSEGAPIPDPSGGFFKNADGSIVLPKLDEASLAAMANQGHGAYRRLSTDDSDFHALLAPFKNLLDEQRSQQAAGMKSDQWRDEGPWLLLPLLLLGAFAFRRGYLFVIIIVLLPMPRPADAMTWQGLWQRDDQRAQQAMAAKQPQQAAQLFHDPAWRAAANYRAGNYQAAVDDLKGINSAEADYNRGNALAQSGHLPEAIQAYDDALKLNPQDGDAKHNRDLVEKMLQKQSPQQRQSNQQNQSKSSAGQQQSQDGQKQGNYQQNGKSDQGQSGKPDQNNQSAGQGADKNSDRDANKDTSKNANASNQSGADAQRQQHDAAAKQAQGQQSATRNDAGQDAGKQTGQHSAPLGAPQQSADNPQPKEMKQADEQWLRRIPDDPGGLWRRKFLYQYKQQQQTQGSEKQPW